MLNFSQFLESKNNISSSEKIREHSEDPLDEDMLAISDSPGFIPVNPEVPGQIMQTPAGIAGGMDTMSLAGPQRKTSTKKKKKAKKGPTKVENRVASFKDFMQRS